ncbi:arsenate reductase (glutaredoxin) [Flavobacteriaceae bacterium]|jgi:arsenate reductase (glutaredoxin)|nr:arsenate reductase (glutaredoxin) [Flavobacteriaceae bacterium]MDA9139297.1 arsenate reductase (glutaredoxin) [Flavobacteriaceae bacterium]MDA9250284.1 arsenate reductase (glutaredoxin) [Flavobacteriaceae bacterium]
MEITIYHNPRCRKSREAVQHLEEHNINFEVVKYLEDKLNEKELSDILAKVGKKPSEILRKNETLWKTEFKNKNLEEREILTVLVKYPKLIERPIVIFNDTGVIARPLENLIAFLKVN